MIIAKTISPEPNSVINLNIGFKTSNQEEIELESDIIMKLEIDLNK